MRFCANKSFLPIGTIDIVNMYSCINSGADEFFILPSVVFNNDTGMSYRLYSFYLTL